MKSWSRSSSSAMASISVSCSNESWIAEADRLDELEERVGVHLLLADKEHVGEDVVVAFAKFVEEHGWTPRGTDAGSAPSIRRTIDRTGSVGGLRAGRRSRARKCRTWWSSARLHATSPTATPEAGGSAERRPTARSPRLAWGCGSAVWWAWTTWRRLPASWSCLRTPGSSCVRVALEHGPVFENIETDGHRRQRWLLDERRHPGRGAPGGVAGRPAAGSWVPWPGNCPTTGRLRFRPMRESVWAGKGCCAISEPTVGWSGRRRRHRLWRAVRVWPASSVDDLPPGFDAGRACAAAGERAPRSC